MLDVGLGRAPQPLGGFGRQRAEAPPELPLQHRAPALGAALPDALLASLLYVSCHHVGLLGIPPPVAAPVIVSQPGVDVDEVEVFRLFAPSSSRSSRPRTAPA